MTLSGKPNPDESANPAAPTTAEPAAPATPTTPTVEATPAAPEPVRKTDAELFAELEARDRAKEAREADMQEKQTQANMQMFRDHLQQRRGPEWAKELNPNSVMQIIGELPRPQSSIPVFSSTDRDVTVQAFRQAEARFFAEVQVAYAERIRQEQQQQKAAAVEVKPEPIPVAAPEAKAPESIPKTDAQLFAKLEAQDRTREAHQASAQETQTGVYVQQFRDHLTERRGADWAKELSPDQIKKIASEVNPPRGSSIPIVTSTDRDVFPAAFKEAQTRFFAEVDAGYNQRIAQAPTQPSVAPSATTVNATPMQTKLDSVLKTESAQLDPGFQPAPPPSTSRPWRDATREPALAVTYILEKKDVEAFQLKSDPLHIILLAQKLIDGLKNIFGEDQKENMSSAIKTGKNGEQCLVAVMPKETMDKIMPGIKEKHNLVQLDAVGLQEVLDTSKDASARKKP